MANMDFDQALEFAIQRKDLIKSIGESEKRLEKLYGKKDHDVEFRKITYKTEIVRLNGLLEDFENLHAKSHLLLSQMPEKQAASEIRFAQSVVDHARYMIKAAPRNLRELNEVRPILECTEICFAEIVPPSHQVVNLTCEVTSIHRPTVVKKADVKLCMVESSIPFPVEKDACQLDTDLPNGILKCAVQYVPKVTSAETCKLKFGLKFERNLMYRTKVLTEVIQAHSNEIDFELNDSSYNCAWELNVVSPLNDKVNLRNFIFGKSYCKVFLKCFWTYFLSSDFGPGKQRILINDIFGYNVWPETCFEFMFMLICCFGQDPSGILTVGSITASKAVVC